MSKTKTIFFLLIVGGIAFVWLSNKGYEVDQDYSRTEALSAGLQSVVGGSDVAEQDDEADYASLLRKAAEGDAYAQFDLGEMYYKGLGVERDAHEAFQWFQKAAVQGHKDAQYELGLRFANGDGVSPNDTKAHVWMSLAASRGSQEAKIYRDSIELRLHGTALANAKSMAQLCSRRDALIVDREATLRLCL